MLALSVADAVAWSALGRERGRPFGRARSALAWLLLIGLGLALNAWPFLAVAPSADELPPPLAALESAWRFGLGALLSAGAFALLRGARGAALGLGLGLLFSSLGRLAYDWALIAQGWRVLGWFAGDFFGALLPFALAVSFALLTAILLHPDARGFRAGLAGALLFLWVAPAGVARWRLELRGFGQARALSEAAGLEPAAASAAESVLWLRQSPAGPMRREDLRAAVDGVDATVDSLEKIRRYLQRTRFGGLFARQAVRVLRKGWLAQWDNERAFEAAALAAPQVAPDYLGALALLRAGPLVPERYGALETLALQAAPRKAGFEDVNTSQLIFEAFSAAYSRFGEEEGAREWLYKVDNLWPIYDKKIEATPLDLLQDGEISGAVLVNGQPAQELSVGLFFVHSSTPNADGALGQTAVPDARGVFAFRRLGSGAYYLGIRGPSDQLPQNALNSPDLIELSPESPVVELAPIRLE